MPQPGARQFAALDVLKSLDPNLSITWDEDTGTPSLIRGSLSAPSLPIAAQTLVEAAHKAAYVFLQENKALYRLRDASQEFPRSRVVSDKSGSTVHLFQVHQGVDVYDGELSVALDQQNRVIQVLGRYRPALRLATEPAVSAEKAVEIALAQLNVEHKELRPTQTRLLVVNTGSFPDVVAKLGKKNHLAWRVEILVWVYFVDARDGSIIFTYDNTQTARNRATYATTNCYSLPGTLWISEDGAVPGQPVDEIAWSAHRHAATVYDYYSGNFGLDSFDGHGRKIVTTVHSGIPNGFSCDQNNAAFIPTMLQFVYGDGDGIRFGPFAKALDVVGHELQHAVTYFAITWPDGSPRGLDYVDESGALNESYSDFFGSLIENKDWFMGEDCYTPNTPNDALRDMADPARYGQPDHYSKYINNGSQSYKVHVNSGIMNKAAYLMSQGGTHYGVTVRGMGKEAVAKIWYRALTYHLQGTSTFKGAREALLQSCQELFAGDMVKYATVRNALAAVGIGDPAPPPSIAVEPASIDFGQVTLGQSAQRTLTVRNTGSGNIAVSSVQSSDPAFAVVGETAFALAPGASKTLAVKFAPTSLGEQRADLTIQSNDGSQPTLTVPLSGTGVGVPRIAVEPTSIDFGTVILGQTAQRTLTVRNSGTASLDVSAVQSSKAAFLVEGQTAFQLAPGASKALMVKFAPTGAGQQQANLTIQSNDNSQPTLSIPLSGTGLGVPRIAVEPASIDFGTVSLGQSAARTLTVRNGGTGNLDISAVQSSKPAFSVAGDTKFQLAPGASKVLTISFAPTSAGQQQANLAIRSNDSSQPTVTVPLSGTGVGVPLIAVEPKSIDFETVFVGLSAQRTVTVRNLGSAELAISAVRCSEPAFAVVGDTAFPLAPGASRALAIKFSPTTAGEQRANLTIHSNDTDQPVLTVPLSGSAVRAPEIGVQPETLDFAAVVRGKSAQLPLTVSNVGGSRLVVSAMRVDQAAFAVVGDSAFQLDPGTTKALAVSFTPTVEGKLQASLSIASNDPQRPTLLVKLSGTGEGVPAGGPHIVLDPKQLNFGAVPVGQSARQNITVKNQGKAPLTILGVRSNPPVYTVVEETAFSIGPRANHLLGVQYKPAAEGTDAGSLTFLSNDPLQPEVSVILFGSGTRCFVATAAYGSPMHKQVPKLREYRDHSLVQSRPGRTLVGLYYRWNEPAADLIAHSRAGRSLARWMLWPLLALARLIFGRKSGGKPTAR